ncbi:MAG: G1 family glutamic endopeptidase [Candidatus Levyibacteriota bacterium]
MQKKPSLLHFMVYSLLLLIVAGIILISLPSQRQVYAQIFAVTPTFSCLGPCAKAAPTANELPKEAPPQVSLSPTIVTTTTNTNPAPSQPCTNSSLTNSQAPAHKSGNFGGQGNKFGTNGNYNGSGGKNFSGKDGGSSSFGGSDGEPGSFDNGNNDRNGFLGIFFKILLLIINMLLQATGSGGLSLPCSPSLSVTPSPSNVPSSISPIISVSTLSPSPGTTTPYLKPQLGTWGGYSTSTAFPANSKISADWKVTALDCSGGDGIISPWPGFGGAGQNDPNIAQLGNDMNCKSGKATYPAWTEAYPASSVYSNNPMKLGDQMTAAVTFQGNGKFATTMTNKTEGWTITAPMSFASSYVPKTAEAILEVLGSSNSKQASVPKFAPLTLTNSNYIINVQQKPLASGPGLVLMELGSSGDAQVTTSAITGGNFTETFVHK